MVETYGRENLFTSQQESSKEKEEGTTILQSPLRAHHQRPKGLSLPPDSATLGIRPLTH